MSKDCRDTALSYLAHRTRTTWEVKTHLLSKGFDEAETEETLQYLQECRYVNDAEYCSDYICYGTGKGRGPVRLQLELVEKGIEAGLIRTALEETFNRQTERDAAMKEAVKLFPAEGSPDEKILEKIGRKLGALGYHTEIIYDIIGKLRK